MSAAPQTPRRAAAAAAHRRGLPAACSDEFPDISISKIRYLEDQGLLAPRRTRGGYRLFDEDDVERLRDDPAPAARRVPAAARDPPGARVAGRAKDAARSATAGSTGRRRSSTSASSCERSGVTPQLVRELEEYGLLEPRGDGGEKRYAEGDAEIAAVCAQLASFGIGPRNLRTFRTAADRQVSLLEQLVAPALRTRNPERRAGRARRSADARRARAGALAAPLLARPPAARLGLMAVTSVDDLKAKIRDVPDLPEQGIVFKDIMPLLADAEALRADDRRARRLGGRAQAGRRARRRGARLLHRRRDRLQARLRLRRRAQAGEAAAGDDQRRSTRSSTARTRSSCTRTRSSDGHARADPRRRARDGGNVEGDGGARRAAGRRPSSGPASSSSSTS